MAGLRSLMSLIESSRRDRFTGARVPQQHSVAAAAVGAGGGSAGFQTLPRQHQYPHFCLAQHQRFEEEEVGRMAGGGARGLWSAAVDQQQRPPAADVALHQRQLNSIQPLPTLANSLVHQGPGPGGQATDWDGGGRIRHIGSMSTRGRMDRNILVDDPQVRLMQQQQSVGNLSRGGEFPTGGTSQEVFGGNLRLRDSRDGILSNELMKSAMRSHLSLIDETAGVEMPSSYHERPAAAAQQHQEQLLDPLSRNRRIMFGIEENGHSELLARYGDGSSSRNLDRAQHAIGRGYQLENFSRKRTREEGNLNSRLIRHRKLSGIDSLSPVSLRSTQSGFRQLQESNEEIQQHNAAKYWQLQTEESEHKAHVQGKHQEVQHKAKYWRQLPAEEDERKANVQRRNDRNQKFQQQKTAKYRQQVQLQKQEDEHEAKGQQKKLNPEMQKHKVGKLWHHMLPQEDGPDVQEKERNQEIQQHNAKYWKLQQTEEDEHEEGQVTTPPPTISPKPQQQQHDIESKIHLLKQEQDVVISSRTEVASKVEGKATGSRSHSSSIYPLEALEFLPSSRPHSRSSRSPKARENENSEGDELKPLGRLREKSLQTRERPQSPKFKNSERTKPRFVGAGFESDLSDMLSGREGIRESRSRTSGLNSKSAGRLYHDGPYQTHQNQVQDFLRKERDIRSLNSSREFKDSRFGGRELDGFLSERIRKESSGRTGNVMKRKTSSKTTAAMKDSRVVGEMTISLQKHGQRIVKVEEYKNRDTVQSRFDSLATNKEHRLLSQGGGSARCGSEDPFLVSSGRDRFSVPKRKDYEGRCPAPNLEKTPRSHSSPRQQYLEKPTAQERFTPYSQHVKNELMVRNGKYDPHRQQSIFSRLVGLRPETNSRKTAAETKRKDCSLLPVYDKASLPSSSRKSPSVLVETSARSDFRRGPNEFGGFQISSRSRSIDFSREFEDSGSKNLNTKNFVADRVPGGQAGPSGWLDKESQKGLSREVSPHLESAATRLAHCGLNVISPSEQGAEDLRKELTLVESPKLKITDHSQSFHDGPALPSGDCGGTARLCSSDMGAAEGPDEMPEDGLKINPKVIATGHRKDQILKKSVVDGEKIVQRNSSLIVESVIPVESLNQDKSEGRPTMLSAEGLLGLESPNSVSKAEWLGKNAYPSDCDHGSSQADLGGRLLISEGNASEVVSKAIQSTGMGSTPDGADLNVDMDESIAAVDTVDVEHPNLPPAVKSLSCLQSLEGISKPVVVELHSDKETENGFSDVPMPFSAISRPREVRLFGANLNAPIGERIDLTPTELESMHDYIFESSNLPKVVEDQDSVSAERNADCAEITNWSGKDVCPPVGEAGKAPLLTLDKPVKGEESLVISNDVVRDLKSTACDLPSGQVQSEELSLVPQEQHPPLPTLQKASAVAPAQGAQLSSLLAPGAHTWHRGTSSRSGPVNNAKIFRSTSLFGGVIQSAGKSKSAQSTAYVRKGNSLVRAPGAANLPSTSGMKVVSVIPGQARHLAKKFPMMKPIPSRNSSISKPTISKPYFSANRKYIAPPTEIDAALVSSVRPVNLPKIPYSNSDQGKSQYSQSALIKASPRAVLQTSDPQLHTGKLLIQHQEQQTRVRSSSAELSVLDKPDDHLGTGAVGRSIDNTSSSHSAEYISVPGILVSSLPETPGSTSRLYVRRKANQLVVAPSQNSDHLSGDTDSMQANKAGHMLGHYFKRKTNQIVRSISGKGSLARNFVRDSVGSGLSSNIPDKRGGGSTLVLKQLRRGRGMRGKKDSPGRSSWVWTLNGSDIGKTINSSTENRRTGAWLFPWKRQNSLRTPVRSQKLKPLPEVKKGSFLFLMSKRLRKVRPVQPVYTRSADGFSLRRSGVMSVGGGNLKWTKSLEKRAKQASEEVTKAVAEAERRKREEKEAFVEAATKAKDERRANRKAARGEGERIVWVGLVRYKMDAASKTLQRVQDLQGVDGNRDRGSSTGGAMASPLLTPRRSIIGGTVYLRVGNGNQLVRDPKTASRALASEKVRWSLHNARSRGAKKQQYCQFFTKFGKCNKESGKCPYIHDPEKVAVCTKFLKGNCKDIQCLLTHKVIPERMPDCSFFLEGFCTNENCPYRHVNVNPKASYCDGFLRGYCKDGDKCNKKHTYVCPVYSEGGECPDRSTCKFHHPKKKVKLDSRVSDRKIGVKSKRRYFSTVEPQPIRRKIEVKNHEEISIVAENGQISHQGSMEFISLSNIESDEEPTVMSPSEPWPDSGATFAKKEAPFAGEREKWIKPTFLLQLTSSAAVAH